MIMNLHWKTIDGHFWWLQVALKSPDAVVTLPIYIGNIAVNLSPIRTVPSSPDHCGVADEPDAAGVTPSAPPVEDDEELCAGGAASEEIPTKSHSQQDPSGQPVTMSPSAFSHAPSSALLPGRRQPNASAPLFCVSTGATIPFFTDGDPTPVRTSSSLILPPEYSSWDYPHGKRDTFSKMSGLCHRWYFWFRFLSCFKNLAFGQGCVDFITMLN